MPLAQQDGYLLFLPSEGGATITALDGTDDSFSPTRALRVDGTSESGNRVSQLIDGTIAVTLVGDRPPAGDLRLLFTEDGPMLTARTILARPTAFQLEIPSRPALNMTFVRQGGLSPVMHNDVVHLWEFRVGYQEVLP